MANKLSLSIPSLISFVSRTPSPIHSDTTESNVNNANVPDESSESENETEPARVFQRRVSTTKNLNGSVSTFFVVDRLIFVWWWWCVGVLGPAGYYEKPQHFHNAIDRIRFLLTLY